MKEFLVNLKSQKYASEVSLGTMVGHLNYLNGLNRIIKGRRYQIDILRDETVADKNNGFKQVLDNQISRKQERNLTTRHHSTFLSGIQKFLFHNVCNISHATGYLNRLVFIVSLLISLRSTALGNMT